MTVPKTLALAGRRVYLYTAKEEGAPLVIVNAFTGDGAAWMETLIEAGVLNYYNCESAVDPYFLCPFY